MPDPNDDDACKSNGAEYEAAGFTSLCIGSIDVVHVRHWNCAGEFCMFVFIFV